MLLCRVALNRLWCRRATFRVEAQGRLFTSVATCADPDGRCRVGEHKREDAKRCLEFGERPSMRNQGCPPLSSALQEEQASCPTRWPDRAPRVCEEPIVRARRSEISYFGAISLSAAVSFVRRPGQRRAAGCGVVVLRRCAQCTALLNAVSSVSFFSLMSPAAYRPSGRLLGALRPPLSSLRQLLLRKKRSACS